ncbi:MAG: LruC domain-containing protein, partial [Spirochaetales bacterium]|nr:LruC domain-containing protein [Spirochaetales bacterium]
YLTDQVQTDLALVEEASVYVTFVHEGAGYRNALGFFTYETAQGPPSSVSESDITLIFPNVSYQGGGGELLSGDKVNIGRFPAGTSIGWVLIANGYSASSQAVGRGLNKFYSVKELNPDPSGHKQHTVLLDYEEESLFLLSFEDLKRPYGDNDFNDAVFYVTTDPYSAVNRSRIVSPSRSTFMPNDSDGDGVQNDYDAEPFNGAVVNYRYTPGENSYGTLAYEDLWPHMGDYDFNDLVLDYRFRESLNSDGEIVALRGEFIITGILASMNNGFALELDLAPSRVASVTGGSYTRGYTFRDSNGTEQRQDKAVIIVFEEANRHYAPEGPAQPLTIDVEFSRPVTRAELGSAPYNPFIMSNGERGREVHLPGKPHTDLAHYEYFGSVDDYSILGTDQMYKTETNQPWAIHIPVSFSYPHDDVPIYRAYKHYNRWVESKGIDYPDWYTHQEGYVDHNYLYFY